MPSTAALKKMQAMVRRYRQLLYGQFYAAARINKEEVDRFITMTKRSPKNSATRVPTFCLLKELLQLLLCE
jgi:hypothetical protein